MHPHMTNQPALDAMRRDMDALAAGGEIAAQAAETVRKFGEAAGGLAKAAGEVRRDGGLR